MKSSYKCSKCGTEVFFGEVHSCERQYDVFGEKTVVYSSLFPNKRSLHRFRLGKLEESEETFRQKFDYETGKLVWKWEEDR